MYARLSYWKPFLSFVGLLMAGQSAHAQTFDATHLSEPTAFSMPLLLHAGDDPDWARPDLDDSNWIVVDPSRSLKDYFPREPRPDVVWYRLHVKVSPWQNGLAIAEMGLADAFDVFVNGKRLISNGTVSPFIPQTPYAYLQASIPDEQIATGSLTIALRIHISRAEWGWPFPGLDGYSPVLGEASALHDRFWLQQIGGNFQAYINDILFLGLGIVALALFAVQRQRTEYLWLFLCGLLGCAGDAAWVILRARNVPLWFGAATTLVNPAFELTLVCLGLSFMQIKPSARVKLIIGFATLLHALGSVGGTTLWFGTAAGIALEAPLEQIAFLAIPIVFVIHLRRGNREAGVLLIPWLMQTINIEFFDSSIWLSQIPSLHTSAPRFWAAATTYHAGPFQFTLGGIIHSLVVTSWALILVWRTIRLSREQALMESELEAARQVQQVILPRESYSVPGFAVEAVYKPAQQVGGDFFQVLSAPGDGLLLVVGDVAGKGMPAAMLVAVLVGAVRTLARFTCDPAEILAELNARLLGRTSGGFSTSIVVHIAASGLVSLANAGHLAPYLDGHEIETSGALPIGIVPGQAYEKLNFQLEPRSQLTFYSDGVVEAQNRAGQMLGFEKARELSTRPAQEIAGTAAEFGQQDDITVVTVEWLPAAGRAAAPERAAGSATLAEMPLEPA
jgi:phosphoserine phosphatase RsbU/P